MKIILCKGFEIGSKPREPSSKPERPFNEEASVNKQIQIENSIVLFMCVEEKDENKKTIAIDTTLKILDIIGRNKERLLVIPFVHLTKKPAKPTNAYITLKEIASRLSNFHKVEKLEFGWHRSLYLKMLSGKDAVKYIEI